MDHHGFMTGMLLGGALVALVPTALLVGVGVYVLRQHRAQQRLDRLAGSQSEEV